MRAIVTINFKRHSELVEVSGQTERELKEAIAATLKKWRKRKKIKSYAVKRLADVVDEEPPATGA